MHDSESWLLLPHLDCCKSRFGARPFDPNEQICCKGKLYAKALFECSRFRNWESPVRLEPSQYSAMHKVRKYILWKPESRLTGPPESFCSLNKLAALIRPGGRHAKSQVSMRYVYGIQYTDLVNYFR